MGAQQMSVEEWNTLQSMLHDHDYFCRHIVKIEPKDINFDQIELAQHDALWREDSTAGMVPYIKRPGQVNFQKFADRMLVEAGYVALAVVKPRQVGWSTEIQSRAYWKCTQIPGLKVLIVSHTAESTGKFLRRMRKMCAAAPAVITPGRPVENKKEIGFANNAHVTIATAGSPDAVRSDNAHILHGSEETSWEREAEIAASIYPALSFKPGSEAFRETTSKGRNTNWHKFIVETQANHDPKTDRWVAKENRWRVFFDPYHNDPRYRTPPPPEWEPDDEAKEHAAMYLGHMSPEEISHRLYWRAMMIKDLRAVWLFKQEFPSSIDESFQSSMNTLYPPEAVYRARANGKSGVIPLDPYAPLVMGVDPARGGEVGRISENKSDRTAIVFRQGNVIRKVLVWDKMDDMQLVGIIASFLQSGLDGKQVSKCFIDYAIGAGAASRLQELGYRREIALINFGHGSSEERYLNKRAEMYMNMRDWFGDTGEQVAIPDNDQVVGDLLAIPDFVQSTGSEKIKLVPKDKIKEQYGRSPDIADACALTFAYAVAGERPAELARFAKQNLAHAPKSEILRLMNDFDR